MGMFFERENNTSYMVMESTKEFVSDYDINVLEKGIVQELLPMHIRNVDKKLFCYYEITGKQQLMRMYTYTKLKWEDVMMICTGIASMVRAVNRYMLDWKYVKMSPEYMYADLSDRKVYFAYIPQCQEEEDRESCDTGLRKLFEYILEHFDHDSPREEVVRVYDIYQRIIQNNYNASELDVLVSEKEESQTYEKADDNREVTDRVTLDVIPPQIIEDEEEKPREGLTNVVMLLKVVAGIVIIMGALGILMPSILPVSIDYKIAIILIIIGALGMVVLGKIPEYVFANVKERRVKQSYELEQVPKEEKDGLCEAESQTMLLSEYVRKKKETKSEDAYLKLVDCESKDIINFEKFPVLMGSLKDKCDVCIDDALISRMHALIVKEGNNFYVEDMNSTNGTKVGDRTLAPNERYMLNDGDEILLATRFYKVEIS